MTSRRSIVPMLRATTSTTESWMREPWLPKAHHKLGVKFGVSHPEALLFLEPGLGKTTIAAAVIKLLKKAKGINKVLLIAPLRVAYIVWSQEEGGELARWEDFKDLKLSLLHGPDKEKALHADADIYIINPDGLDWLTSNDRIEGLLERGVNMLVVDELSKFKHVKTRRWKSLKPYLRFFKRRLGMTGSPASNGLLDLFGQAKLIDLGKALGEYITKYRFKYFFPTDQFGHVWQPQEGAEDRIYEALAPIALSMKAEDYIDLPELVEDNIFVDLPPKVRKIYDELEDELITMIDDEVVTAANAGVASMKCRQVASGGLYVDVEKDDEVVREVRQLHTAKSEALIDLVDELQGSPLLIAYEFQHDLTRIRTALGNIPSIGGGTTPKESVAIARAWNRGELPALAGHPAAMGMGLNLQAAGNHICWYSTTWDFELYDQLIRRVWRSGNTNKRVFVHRLVTRGTVDGLVLRAIARKRTGQLALFDALKELAASRRHRR